MPIKRSTLSAWDESKDSARAPWKDELICIRRDSSQADKVDLLIGMVTSLVGQSDKLSQEFELFKSMTENQTHLLTILDKKFNCMPLTFMVLPRLQPAKLAASASMSKKAINFLKRKTMGAFELLWTESTIIFVCPVTLKQVAVGAEL